MPGVVAEALRHDMTLLGASNEGAFSHLFFGAIPQQIIADHNGVCMIVQTHEGGVGSYLSRQWAAGTKLSA